MADVAGKMVGIDLGTTFSAIATLDNSANPVTLPNRDGEMLTPSAVLLDGDSIVIGQAALDVSLEHPDRVATLIKRRMGYASYGRLIDGREFRPETLSAILLRKLVQDAELRIGPVRKAVITVPAYFDDTRRKATKDAGRIAGLEVLDILDEPTAAALAYSFQPPRRAGTLLPDRILPDEQRTVLVYDLGGGTFDATLVRCARAASRPWPSKATSASAARTGTTASSITWPINSSRNTAKIRAATRSPSRCWRPPPNGPSGL